MLGLMAGVAVAVVIAWLLRRAVPAMFAVAIVLLVPLWLIGGLAFDLLRWPFVALSKRTKSQNNKSV